MGQAGGREIPAGGSGARGPKVVRFRSFEVDFQTGELRKGNRRIRLRDKSLEVLAVLMEQPGRLVTRDELRARLWADDVFVDFENNINCAVSRLRYALGDSAARPRFIETLPRKGYRLLLSPSELSSVNGTPVGPGMKLLVLPFQNITRELDQEYLSDGVTEEVIVRLATSGLEGVRVVARATAMSYRGTRKTVAQIGRELGVTYIVEGSLFRTGSHLRINISIVHVPDGTQVWATSRDAPLDRIMALQREVADRVARQLRSLVSGDQALPASSLRMTDATTYDIFLQGRFQYRQLTYDGLTSAIRHFKRCVSNDASYAPAWASLANSLALLGFWGYAPLPEVMPEAERSARKAIALDPQSALGHNALAIVSLFYLWDLDSAENEFFRALELSPGESDIRWPLFMFLSSMRADHDRAAREARITEELDPASVVVSANVGWVYYWARRFDDGIAQARRALDMSPDCIQAYYLLGACQLAKASFTEAIRTYEKAFSFYRDSYSLGLLTLAFGLAGAKSRAAELFDDLSHRAQCGYVPAMSFAVAAMGLADPDRVFEWLDRSYSNHEAQVLFLRHMPLYDGLRSDPRFERLVERVSMTPPLKPADS